MLKRRKLESKHDATFGKEEISDYLNEEFDIQAISVLLVYAELLSKAIEFEDLEAKILTINLLTFTFEAVLKTNPDFAALNGAANINVG